MSGHNFPPLEPLRIPGGWTVLWNAIYEENPEERFQDFQNEDIFMARNDEVCVDLGWYPAGDREGRYVLVVVVDVPEADDCDAWSDPRYRFETRIRLEAIKELERVLAQGV
jgi:hypothetical protein